MKSLGLREGPKREIQGVERKDDNVEECGAGELQGAGWMLLCQPQHFYFHENVKILETGVLSVVCCREMPLKPPAKALGIFITQALVLALVLQGALFPGRLGWGQK